MELLLTIGVMAVLLVLCVPVFKAVSRNSQGVRCIQQLQQITQALLLYRADHDGELLPDLRSGSNSSHWTGAVDKYLGIPNSVATLGSSPLWSCPANPAIPSSTSKNGPGEPPYSASYVSYARNSNLKKNDGSWTAWKAGRVTNSSTLILVIERRVNHIAGTGVDLTTLTKLRGGETVPNGGFFDHPQGTSVAFVDGHLESWRRTHPGLGGGKPSPASAKEPNVNRYWQIIE